MQEKLTLTASIPEIFNASVFSQFLAKSIHKRRISKIASLRFCIDAKQFHNNPAVHAHSNFLTLHFASESCDISSRRSLSESPLYTHHLCDSPAEGCPPLIKTGSMLLFYIRTIYT